MRFFVTRRLPHGAPAPFIWASLLLCLNAGRGLAAEDADPKTVLATVNGSAITAGDLAFGLLLRKVPSEDQGRVRKQVLEQLIDQRLLQEFLRERKATATEEDVAAQVAKIHNVIKLSGGEPDEVLPKLGFTEERLKQEVGAMLAWNIHARRIIPDMQLREFWQSHRSELDGTQVRAAHIFVKVDAAAGEAAWKEAEEKLSRLREEIVSGRTSFAVAVKEHSQAPSKTGEGDVGFFPYRGKMPVEFTRAAFALKTGDVSEPARTPFGVHLIKATERKTGDLSLEDVRGEVFQRVQLELRERILADLRSKAKIERTAEKP